MNFRTKDSPMFLGVAASFASFALGVFTAFCISGTQVFILNLLLFLVGLCLFAVSFILLIASLEVYHRTHGTKENFVSNSVAHVYQIASGSESVSMTSDEIMETLSEDKKDIPKHIKGLIGRAKNSLANALDVPDSLKVDKVTVEYNMYPDDSGIFDLSKERYDTNEEIRNGNAAPNDNTKVFPNKKTDDIIAKSYAIEKSLLKDGPTKAITIVKDSDVSVDVVSTVELVPLVDTDPIEENVSETLVTVDTLETVETPETVEETVEPIVLPIPYPKTPPTIHQKDVSIHDTIVEVVNDVVESAPLDEKYLRKIIVVGESGIQHDSKEFKNLLLGSYLLTETSPGYKLRLKGKTHGLGARGIKTVRKNTEFVSFDGSDIKKMLKKFEI